MIVIIKYLKRTKNHMLVYTGDDLILVGYIDSDVISNKDVRKSIFRLRVYIRKWTYELEECETKLYR